MLARGARYLYLALCAASVLSTKHGTCQQSMDGDESAGTPREQVLRVAVPDTIATTTTDSARVTIEYDTIRVVDRLLEQPTYDNVWLAGRYLTFLANNRSLAGLPMNSQQEQDYTERWITLCRILSDSVMIDTTERFLVMLRGTYQGLYNNRGILPVLGINPQGHGLDTLFVYSVNALYARLNDEAYAAYESLRRERLPQVQVNPPQDTTLTQLGRCLQAYARTVGLMRGIATTYYPLQVDTLTGLWNVTGNLFNFCRDQNGEGFLQYFQPDSTRE